MPKKTNLVLAALALLLLAGTQIWAQSDYEDEDAVPQTPRRYSRSAPVIRPTAGDEPGDDSEESDEPLPPTRPASRRSTGRTDGGSSPATTQNNRNRPADARDRATDAPRSSRQARDDDDLTQSPRGTSSRAAHMKEVVQRSMASRRDAGRAPRPRDSRAAYQPVQYEPEEESEAVTDEEEESLQNLPPSRPRGRAAQYTEDADSRLGLVYTEEPPGPEVEQYAPPSPDGNAGDLQSVLDRLSNAEAVIQKQQHELDQLHPLIAPYSKGTAVFGNWGNDNLTFTSKDGNFKAHIGGVVQMDVVGFSNTNPAIGIPGGNGIQEAVEFRRLRLRAEGSMYDNIDWVSEVDLALALQNTDQLSAAAAVTGLRSFPTGVGVQGGNTINVIQPTTVFMTFKEVPFFGNVRVGNQQNWISFDHIESARFLDFMERAPIMDAFSGANNNGYAPGISAFNNNSDKTVGWQYGVYKNNVYDSGFSYNVGDAWIYGGRMIASPYYDEESKGRYMVHTGIGTEWRSMNSNVSAATGFDNIRVRSRGDLRNAAATIDPNFADTGNFYAVSQTLVNPELMVQWGSLIIQSEYSASWFNGAKAAQNLPGSGLGNVFFSGGYCEMLYFLTGENRDYNRQSGVFGRVIPKETFSLAKGTWGAWQVGVRYDWLDLNSGHAANGGNIVNGGNNDNMTIGLNWFLNPSARFQLNYVASWINNQASVTFPGTVGALNGARFTGDGPVNSFGARMDFNF